MKVRVVILAVAVLAGVAADKPQRTDEDLVAVYSAARKYQPEGVAIAQVSFNPSRTMAYVRYSIRRDGQDIALSVISLKKTGNGWEVESCAR